MKHRVYILGDKLSVDGDHTLAVEAWKEQLRILAGMLYVCFMFTFTYSSLIFGPALHILLSLLGNIQQTCSKM